MASNDALRAVVRELGITIQEESSDIQRERDGEYSYSVQIRLTTKSRPVRLARVERVKLYQETWERPATEYDSWMLLSVPESELARARRQLEGKVLMAWECRAVPDSLCRQALLEPIAAVATAGGYALLPEYVQAPPQADLVALGITQDAAYVLHISMEAEFAQESHGEFYATGHGQLRLIDTGDGKVLLSLESGPLKGGQFCRSKAIEVALEGIIRVLAEQLGTGSGL